MSGASFIGEQASVLDAVLLRLKRDEETRRRAMRRTLAAVAVGLMHLAIIVVLLRTQWLPQPRQIRAEQPPLLWLLLPALPGNPVIPHKHRAQAEQQAPPATIVLPITHPPPPQSTETFNPATALGEALACGANSYEYLSPERRDRCKRMPWHYKFDRYGDIVLDVEARPEEEQQPKETGAEANQRMMNTADPCLAAKMTGTPCIEQTIYGNGPH